MVFFLKIDGNRDFPGGPVVKSLCFQCRGHRFDLWLGNKDPTCHAARPKNKQTKKNTKKYTICTSARGKDHIIYFSGSSPVHNM